MDRFVHKKQEKQDGIQTIKQKSVETRGVSNDLVETVKAIERRQADFGVIYGPRTITEQEKLVATGRSQTMKSSTCYKMTARHTPSI